MIPIFKKKYIIPVVASALLFLGASFTFEIAKQIEIFTTLFKELNTNYVDETNPGDLMDNAIKGVSRPGSLYCLF
jgi:carboxyl-terminal processing protease